VSETKGSTPIRVLVVDDYPFTREMLAELLERRPDMTVVGQAGSLAEARAVLAAGVVVDAALVDLALPDGTGAELIRELRRRHPGAVAIALTGSRERLDHARAVEAGASAVLHKTAPTRQIAEAVRRLRSGEVLMAAEDLAALRRLAGEHRVREEADRRALAQLTPRDRELLAALAEGLADKEIATRLGVTHKTVRNQMVALLDKLGVESRTQALIAAARLGIVRLE